MPTDTRFERRSGGALLVAAILIVAVTATIGGIRHTSTTFDEIITISAGARGFRTGRFDMIADHPPMMQYVYGLPAFLMRPSFPPESADGSPPDRYLYATALFGSVGNDPERLVFLPRLAASACAALLVLAVFVLTRRRVGAPSAIFAAVLCAFLPDVLAHGGVAYSDVPLALCWLCSLFAMDALVRDPSRRNAVIAGVWVAVSIGIKFSAVMIVPAAVLLVVAEAVARPHDRQWRSSLIRAAAVAEISAYLVIVAIFRGDFALSEMIRGLGLTLTHVSAGHDVAPAYLLGRTSQDGWWYFFPLVFFLKTPVALHVLMAIALVGLVGRAPRRWRDWSRSPLRAPVVGSFVFGASLVTSRLDIGFRYALPFLPMLCILVGAGLGRLWPTVRTPIRAGIAALCAWYALSSLSWYPHFLPYLSEYWRWPDAGYRALADSSLDWGQGLLEVRDYMRRNSIRRIYLGYFGSNLPEAYGIDYVPLPSFFDLPPHPLPRGEPPPELAIVSATLLAGLYVHGDPFADLRARRPVAVLGHTMYVFHASDVAAVEEATRAP